MPQERTEEQILTRAPIKAKLGDKEYDLPILPVIKMAAWRKKFIEVTNEFAGVGVTLALVGQAFIAMPEKIADLVFAYHPALPKKEILKTATEEQLAAVLSQIIPVAFPFVRQLSLMKSVLMATQLASEKSTSSSSPSTGSPRIM